MKIERKHDEEHRLEAAIAHLASSKKLKEQADALVKDAELKVVDLMHKMREKSYISTVGELQFKATVVHAERIKVDGEGLKATLGTRKFNTVADYKVSQSKLTKAIEDGKIDQEVVAPFLTVQETKPYIRLTEAQEEETD
jgi:hypothetical protein